jgi:hypothetical protein
LQSLPGTQFTVHADLDLAFLTFLPVSANAEAAESNVKANTPINTFFIFIYLR